MSESNFVSSAHVRIDFWVGFVIHLSEQLNIYTKRTKVFAHTKFIA